MMEKMKNSKALHAVMFLLIIFAHRSVIILPAFNYVIQAFYSNSLTLALFISLQFGDKNCMGKYSPPRIEWLRHIFT